MPSNDLSGVGGALGVDLCLQRADLLLHHAYFFFLSGGDVLLVDYENLGVALDDERLLPGPDVGVAQKPLEDLEGSHIL